jgi:hypothetical protein
MMVWHCILGVLAVLGLVAALYGLDRLGLWLEDRGLLYYRRKRAQGGSAGWVALQQFVEPGMKHVCDVRLATSAERESLVLAELISCLAAGEVNVEEVRVCLFVAQQTGLDCERLYAEAVAHELSIRPERFGALLPWKDVAPRDCHDRP